MTKKKKTQAKQAEIESTDSRKLENDKRLLMLLPLARLYAYFPARKNNVGKHNDKNQEPDI